MSEAANQLQIGMLAQQQRDRRAPVQQHRPVAVL